MPAAPVVGLFGRFDVESYGDLLYPRIFERELRRRLPEAGVRPFSPFGGERRVPLSGGWSAEPMGLWTRERLRELAHSLHAVVVGGSGLVHERDELLAPLYGVDPLMMRLRRPSDFFLRGLHGLRPLLWHAVGAPFEIDPFAARELAAAAAPRVYASAADARSAERLAAALNAPVAVAADPAWAADALLEPGDREARVRDLRSRGVLPAEGAFVVVQGDDALGVHGDAIAAAVNAALADWGVAAVVLLEAGVWGGGDRFADVLAERVDAPVHRMRTGTTLEDVVAGLSAASAFAGRSPRAAITALTFGRPAVVLDLPPLPPAEIGEVAEVPDGTRVDDPARVEPALRAALATPPPDAAGARGRVAQEFDRLAAELRDAPEEPAVREPSHAPPGDGELDRRRVLEERRRYAELLQDALDHLAAARRRIAELEEAARPR